MCPLSRHTYFLECTGKNVFIFAYPGTPHETPLHRFLTYLSFLRKSLHARNFTTFSACHRWFVKTFLIVLYLGDSLNHKVLIRCCSVCKMKYFNRYFYAFSFYQLYNKNKSCQFCRTEYLF